MHIALDHTAHEDTVLARRDRQVPGKGPIVDAVSLRARARTRGDRARGEGDAPEHLAIASSPHHREVLMGGTRRVGVRQVVRDDDQLVGIGAQVAARADGGDGRPRRRRPRRGPARSATHPRPAQAVPCGGDGSVSCMLLALNGHRSA